MVCQEDMRRVRLARRLLGIERREDVGVALLLLLLLLVDEEVRRVRMCWLETCSLGKLSW